jgi:hypothetical protein
VRGADELLCNAAHLTLPGANAPGPLPLPPEGRRGAFLSAAEGGEGVSECDWDRGQVRQVMIALGALLLLEVTAMKVRIEYCVP